MLKIGSNSPKFGQKSFLGVIYHEIKKCSKFGVFGRVCVLAVIRSALEQ